MKELIDFLLACMAEDERAALSASPPPWTYQDVDSVGGGRLCDATVAIAELSYDPTRRTDRPADPPDPYRR